MKILLVEDDLMIGDALQYSLNKANYAVDWVKDGCSALLSAKTQHYDAVLLDLGLPKVDGLEVLRTLRKSGNTTPVLIVSARDAVATRIDALDLGADDYVLKPFDMDELSARIRAVVRRKSGHANSILQNGNLSLNLSTREATVDDIAVRLSAREYALLEALLIRPGAILSRQDLEDRVYQSAVEVESNAIEFLIHGLRKKIGAHLIKNVRGLGWTISKKD